jgi:hypothetical protein
LALLTGVATAGIAGLVVWHIHPMRRQRHRHITGPAVMEWRPLDSDLQRYAGVGPDFLLARLPAGRDEMPIEPVKITGVVWVYRFRVREPYWWPRDFFFGRRVRWLSCLLPKRLDTFFSTPPAMVLQPLPYDEQAAAALAAALAAQVRRWHCMPEAGPSRRTAWSEAALAATCLARRPTSNPVHVRNPVARTGFPHVGDFFRAFTGAF